MTPSDPPCNKPGGKSGMAFWTISMIWEYCFFSSFNNWILKEKNDDWERGGGGETFDEEDEVVVWVYPLEVFVEDNLLIPFDNVESMHNVSHRDYSKISQKLNVFDHSSKKDKWKCVKKRKAQYLLLQSE